MGRHETIVPTEPPAPRAPAVLKHLQISKQALVALGREVPGLLLAVAEERPGAKENLAALREKISQVEFEIAQNAGARLLAERLDQDTTAEWKRLVQTLPVGEILEGLTRESCPRRCVNSCVISGADPQSGGPCQHPVRERHSFGRDATGQRIFPYRDNRQASRVFDAACEKLGVRSEFA
jgi:hypothetical protein